MPVVAAGRDERDACGYPGCLQHHPDVRLECERDPDSQPLQPLIHTLTTDERLKPAGTGREASSTFAG
jgi:hypothetical protein